MSWLGRRVTMSLRLSDVPALGESAGTGRDAISLQASWYCRLLSVGRTTWVGRLRCFLSG